MKMPSHMPSQAHFSLVPRADIPRSKFNRNHTLKTTFNSGLLVPVYLDEALPGDTFHLRMAGFCRLATPVKPVMDNLYLDTFFFAVPLRLLWTNFKKFMGEQTNPADSISYLLPSTTVPVAGYNSGSLEDYFGIPVGVASNVSPWTHCALPRRAYYRIWDEWFRDENLQNSYATGGIYGDGPDVPPAGGTALLRRGKRRDYFTSCLPWPQKFQSVDLPLADAPVTVDAGTAIGFVRSDLGGTRLLNDAGASNIVATATSGGLTAYADVSQVATINELREAFQIQKLLERDARGGTRYTEIVRSHFGVTSPDARQQRAEYLGGGRALITISPIAQTSSTDVTTPQGNLAAMGTGSWSGHGFVKSFTEHCIVMGLACVTADLTYQQGLERMWSRSTRYDFYWPSLAHLGEQSVLNKEIYLQDAAANENTFGYQERYAEYRYKPSLITGLFRSNPTGGAATLDMWHLSQDFGALPTLGSTFIQEMPPVDRVVAVPTEPQLLLDAYYQLTCARPMPVYSVPGMIDHF